MTIYEGKEWESYFHIYMLFFMMYKKCIVQTSASWSASMIIYSLLWGGGVYRFMLSLLLHIKDYIYGKNT